MALARSNVRLALASGMLGQERQFEWAGRFTH